MTDFYIHSLFAFTVTVIVALALYRSNLKLSQFLFGLVGAAISLVASAYLLAFLISTIWSDALPGLLFYAVLATALSPLAAVFGFILAARLFERRWPKNS